MLFLKNNRVFLTGCIVQPEVKISKNGYEFLKFILEVPRGKEKIDFFDCVLLRNLEGLTLNEYQVVSISGHLESYKSKENNKVNVVCDDIE